MTQINPEGLSSENLESDFAVARTVDEFESLGLALGAIKARRPDLTPEEQYERALCVAGDFMLLENRAARVAELGHKLDAFLE